MGNRKNKKNKKSKKQKESLARPAPCSKCKEMTYQFICGMCPDCWNEVK